ncbi:MAG: hypothetical protein IVW52_04965 [Acidimicrobiales bacterium]|nr:hypothetical protein [Acidimicrobiales bacterium]
MAEENLRELIERVGALRAQAATAEARGNLEDAARLLYTTISGLEGEARQRCLWCGGKESTLEKGDWFLEGGIPFEAFSGLVADHARFHRACARKLAMDLVVLLAGKGPQPPRLV